MTLEEYQRRLRAVVQEVEQQHPQIMLALANSALNVIIDRVQNKGVDKSGARYSPYSTKPMLVGRSSFLTDGAFAEFKSKQMLSRSSSLAKKKKAKKTFVWRTVKGKKLMLLEGGYKKFREYHKLQTDYKDFTFTGQMWRSVGLRLLDSRTVIIKSLTADKQKVMNGLLSRGYTLLDLSDSEKRNLLKDYDDMILKLFRKNGL